MAKAQYRFTVCSYVHTQVVSHARRKSPVWKSVPRLPGPDALQGALAGGHRWSLVRLRLRGAAETARVAQVHVHEGAGSAGGGQRGNAAVRAAVVAVVGRAVVCVGRVSVVTVRVGTVRSRRVALRPAQTRLPVPDQDRDGDAPRRRRVVLARRLQGFVLSLPFAFVAAVLEPDLHLVGGEFEGGRQVLALRRGQVALLLEASLQLEDLSLGKEDPGSPPAPLLLRRSLRVALRVLRCLIPGHKTTAIWAQTYRKY